MCHTPAAPSPDIEKSLCAPSLAGDLLLLLLAPLGQLCIWFGDLMWLHVTSIIAGAATGAFTKVITCLIRHSRLL